MQKGENMKLKPEEKIEDLEYNGLKIIQKKDGFRFGIDAVILSDFVKKNIDKSIVLDIGTGTGIISILLAGKTNAKKIIGLDIQQQVCDMAKRSVELNNLQERVEIVNGDVKNIENIIERNSVDIIVTNPPYQKGNTGLLSENESEKISRHEILCTFEDICKSAKYVLKSKGEMYIIHRPERIVDIMCFLRNNGIEPKEIRFVEPHLGEKPNLVLIKAIKNGNPFLKVHTPLVIYNSDRTYTSEILKIYGKDRREC